MFANEPFQNQIPSRHETKKILFQTANRDPVYSLNAITEVYHHRQPKL